MEFTPEADNDPQNWTVDQIVHELCHNPNPRWSTLQPPHLIPDRQSLEPVFRQNHVDGDTLLALEFSMLRDELGIQSLGQRRSIMKAIESLRYHSQSYQQTLLRSEPLTHVHPRPSPYTTHMSASGLSHFTQSPTITGLGFMPPPHFNATRSPSVISGIDHLRQRASNLRQTSELEFQQPQAEIPQPRMTPPIDRPMNEAESSGHSQTRIVPIDILHASVDAELSKNSCTSSALNRTSPAGLNNPEKLVLPKKEKKRIAPTLVPRIKEVATDDTYLSAASKTLQDIFYYKVDTDWDDQFYRLPDDDSLEFFLQGSPYPTGNQRLIAARLIHFLRQDVQVMPESRALARLPYGSKRLQPPSSQYFTLIPKGEARPRVCRIEDFPALMLSQNKSRHSAAPHVLQVDLEIPHLKPEKRLSDQDYSDLDDLAYLLDKYPAGDSDDILPVFGDSGDEGELDEETWKEYQAEQVEQIASSSALTQEEIENTIDSTLEQYKQDWRDKRLPKVQLKAYRIWMTAAKQNNRQVPLANSQFWKSRSTARLAKLKEALMKDVWQKVADVQHQCQNMELTVHDLEEHSYYIRALQSNSPPPRPSKNALLSLSASVEPPLELDEELIESESDIVALQSDEDNDEDNDENNFIDDEDMSDAGSIHHEPDLDPGWAPHIPEPERNVTAVVNDTAVHKPIPDAKASTEVDQILPDANDNDADDESEDDIRSPSRARKRRPEQTPSPLKNHSVKHEKPSYDPKSPLNQVRTMIINSGSDSSDTDPPRPLPKSRYAAKGRSLDDTIDLTSSSPPSTTDHSSKGVGAEFDVHTPDLNSASDKKHTDTESVRSNLMSKSSDYSSSESFKFTTRTLPIPEDIRGIDDLDWAVIEKAKDGQRALAKAVFSMEAEEFLRLKRFIDNIPPNDHERYRELILNGLVAMSGHNDVVEGVKRGDHATAILLVLLFLTFYFAQNLLDAWSVTRAHVTNAHLKLGDNCYSFFDQLRKLIEVFAGGSTKIKGEYNQRKRKRAQGFLSEQEDLIEDSDIHITDDPSSDQQIPEPPSSHKKRKRAVAESQEANLQQLNDQKRIEEQDRRRAIMEEKFSRLEAKGEVARPVNFTDPIVYLNPSIAQRVKPHQMRGIQFMWREIVEDPKHQGCILAHTMGLGKTMQVISLLITIAQCNQSKEENMRNHIHPHLRKLHALVLCPASLLDNWEEELFMWSPKGHHVMDIYKVSSTDKRSIMEWSRSGGILLISYERFLRVVDVDEKPSSEKSKFRVLEEILLKRPGLVIADEAHKLKNPKSKIAQVARRFKTLSRIALTGSPLNNHLEEYHTMVDWIAPGYLGNLVQFRAKYSEPIANGLFADSTKSEKRTSLRKLHVLKKDLGPKIERADITAIEQDMPSKTEYFITIPLTELQKEAYDIYVKSVLELNTTLSQKSRNTSLWNWLAMLRWLCNHPICWVEGLKQRQKAYEKSDGTDDFQNDVEAQIDSDMSPPEGLPDEFTIDPNGPMKEAIEKVSRIFEGVAAAGKLDKIKHSYRTLIVDNILRAAISAGDKTLIFSHNILTLDFLEIMLKKRKYKYCRLDGTTAVGKRQGMTKAFNQENSFHVFLISMRAGGLGMNLQGANRVIIFDFSYNPSWEEQAVGRAYRLGQKRPVFVYRFRAGGTFEEVMFDKSVFKTQLFNRVIDQKNPLSHASKSVNDWIFPVREVEQQEFDECLGKDEKVLDQIIKRVDYIRNIELTETFQREDEDVLDEEETLAAEAEYRDEQLLRENPAAYHEKHQREILEKAQGVQQTHQRIDWRPTVASYGVHGSARYPKVQAPGSLTWSSTQGPRVLPSAPFVRADFDIPASTMQSLGTSGLGHGAQATQPLLRGFDDTATVPQLHQVDRHARGRSAGPEGTS